MGRAEYTNLNKINAMDDTALNLSNVLYSGIVHLRNNGIITEDELEVLISDPSKIKDYSDKDGITDEIVKRFSDINEKRLSALDEAKSLRESDEAKEELQAKLDFIDERIKEARKEKDRLNKLREKASDENEIKLLDLEIEKQNRIIANYVLNKEYNALIFKTGISDKLQDAGAFKYGRDAEFEDAITKVNKRIVENEYKIYSDGKLIYILNKKGTKFEPAKKEPEKNQNSGKGKKPSQPSKFKDPASNGGKSKAGEGEQRIVKKEKNHKLKDWCKEHPGKAIGTGILVLSLLVAGLGIYSHFSNKDKVDIDTATVQATVEPKVADDDGKTEEAENNNEPTSELGHEADNSNVPSSESAAPTNTSNEKVEVPDPPTEEKEPSNVPNRNNGTGTNSENTNNENSNAVKQVDPLFGSYTVGSNVPLFGDNNIYYNYDTNEVIYNDQGASYINNGESEQTSSSSEIADELQNYYNSQIEANRIVISSGNYGNHAQATSAIGAQVENIRAADGSDPEQVKQAIDRAMSIIDGDNEGMTSAEIAKVCVDGISATAYGDPDEYEAERRRFEAMYEHHKNIEANAPTKVLGGGY